MNASTQAFPNNSTTGRSKKKDPPFELRVMRATLGALARVSTAGAAAMSERLFLTPRRRERPASEQEILARGRRVALSCGNESLAAWEWGESGPRVFLVHGWEGRGAQLGGFVLPLLSLGFRVVTFDAKGHGDSPGARSSLFDFADAVTSAEATFGPFHAIITHSMGGPATLWACRERRLAERVVMIAPPKDLRDFTRAFASLLGISESVRQQVHARLAVRFGVPLEDARAEVVARTMRGPLLVVHDEDDREVPIECGELIANAWPGAGLVRTRGLGHQRILRDVDTRNTILRFVAQSAAQDGASTEHARLMNGEG